MDSFTQLVLGACTAAVCVPAQHRRAGLLAGAALGTLPDLDVLVLALVDDPISRMTWHRGPSHSLLVLSAFALLSWSLLRRRWTPVRAAPRRWLVAIALALLTHPLLDAHTVYGTQLWWPLPVAPTMWSTIFIIDPLYTTPLVIAAASAWFLRNPRPARWALGLGLALSGAYLGWSWIAKTIVERRFELALAAAGHADAAHFTVPTTFNTWVWRAVALTPEAVLEGYIGVGDERTAHVQSYPRDALARDPVLRALPAVVRLDHFASGFVDLRAENGDVVLLDLRMGAHPHYFFRFAVAEDAPGGWREIPPRALPRPGFSWERLVDQWRGR